MGSPYAGAVAVSVFVGIVLLIIGIEVTVVGITGRRIPITPSDKTLREQTTKTYTAL